MILAWGIACVLTVSDFKGSAPPQQTPAPPPARAEGADDKSETADLRFKGAPGDVLKCKYTTESRFYGPDEKPSNDFIRFEAVIEGRVDKAETPPGGTKIDFKYTSLRAERTSPSVKMSAASGVEPVDAPGKLLRKIIDQIMAKTITVTYNAEGKLVGVTGLPQHVFEAVGEYMTPNQEALKAAGREAAPVFAHLVQFGTASNLRWSVLAHGPGVEPPSNARVGDKWLRYTEGREPEYLQLAELKDGRAVVTGVDEKDIGDPGDPLRTPTKLVWDAKRGRLAEFELSFDSRVMGEFTDQPALQRERLVEIRHAEPKSNTKKKE